MEAFEILPYETHYALPVAELLARRRRERREARPELPPGLSDLRSAGRILDEAGPGWLALGGEGRLAGFLFPKRVADELWGPSLELSADAWALAPGAPETLLPRLFARAAEASGPLPPAFAAYCPAEDEEGLRAWFRLGFGLEQAYAVAALAELGAEASLPAGVEIRRAGPGDEELLAGLSSLIATYQAGPPVWAGAPPAYLAALEEGFRKLPADEEAIVLLALEGGRALGYQAWFPMDHPPEDAGSEEGLLGKAAELSVSALLPEERGRGLGLALTARGIAEARAAGYGTAFTDWRTANPLSSAFWPARGFRPYLYRLTRRLDPAALEAAARRRAGAS